MAGHCRHRGGLESGARHWHMVDLLWMQLFPEVDVPDGSPCQHRKRGRPLTGTAPVWHRHRLLAWPLPMPVALPSCRHIRCSAKLRAPPHDDGMSATGRKTLIVFDQ